MSDFEVKGADQFLRLSKALKQAGRTELRKELTKGLRDGARPLIPLARAAARQQIPHRGGLADLVAREPMRVQVRTGAKTAGVRIVVGNRRGAARATNAGLLRHPVFGTAVCVSQRVTESAGWFDETLTRNAPIVRPELERALQRVADRVVKGV